SGLKLLGCFGGFSGVFKRLQLHQSHTTLQVLKVLCKSSPWVQIHLQRLSRLTPRDESVPRKPSVLENMISCNDLLKNISYPLTVIDYGRYFFFILTNPSIHF
ncbi:unnamed protein product, partial [Allacma fusca]